jgi:hypothetical protein
VSLIHYQFLTAAPKTQPNLCVYFICDGRNVTLVAIFEGFWWSCWLQIPVEVAPSSAPPDPAFTNAMVRDALNKAVMEFEETLQRSHATQVTYTILQTDVTGQPTAVEVTETGKFSSMSLMEISDDSICIVLRVLLNCCEKVCVTICIVQLKINPRKIISPFVRIQ